MNRENSEDNKKSFFKQQFDNLMIDYVNDRFEFYKKIEENQAMKNTIFQMMYSEWSVDIALLESVGRWIDLPMGGGWTYLLISTPLSSSWGKYVLR